MLTRWLSLLVLVPLSAVAAERQADVIIYGGTPAGIMAAIAAARENASVLVVEPTHWLGGMVSGGLSRTDIGKSETIGGYPREFFARAAMGLEEKDFWFAEPKANLTAFHELLDEAKVAALTDQPLRSVTREGLRIASLTTTDGTVFRGRMFIDASYEGDLMAVAGVSCVFGRESRQQYDEGLAGVCPMPIRPLSAEIMAGGGKVRGGFIHGTPALIPGRDDSGQPLFGVTATQVEPGAADTLLQAYTYRLCVTQGENLRIPFPKPTAYDPTHYELALRLIRAFPVVSFNRICNLSPIAHGKFDLNSQGLCSTDLPGGNIGYITGDAATRAKIRAAHRDWIQGLLWFLGHDDRVPESLREQTNRWGLCRDEFVDNDHWPYALYVREARRMIGAYIMTQQDCQERRTKPDSVAMGSFTIDCHMVQRILAEDGTVRDEGSFANGPTKPYQIPYRCLIPKAGDCANLLVPVCLSASHVAICSLRMEPVYMVLGQAAGVAAALAITADQAVQEVDIPALQAHLRSQKAVIAPPAP
jgi:FAD dependent oxidoreductase